MLASTLATYAYNDYPLIFDLTDGQVIQLVIRATLRGLSHNALKSSPFTDQVHHLLQIVVSELYEWVGLTSQQAYWKHSELLLSFKSLRHPALESISEDLQAPVRRLRAALRNGGGGEGVTLRQQLDSVIPFLPAEERIQAT